MTSTMRPRFIALVLSPILLAVACSSGGSGGSGGDSAQAAAGQCPVAALDKVTEPVNITFWQSGLSQSLGDAIKTMVGNYNAAQQKVHVTLQFQGTYDEGSDKYLTALRGGTLPDLVLLEETRLQLMIDSKSVIPAQACIDAAKYDTSDHLPAVLREFTVDKQLWPMPFNVSNPVLYYDTNDFAKAGLDPNAPPKTFADVVAAAKKIKASGAAGTGLAWEMSAWYFEQWFAKAGQTVVDHDNGRAGRAEKATLNNATGKEILGFVKQLFDEGLALNVGRNESGTDTLLALGKGDAAMTAYTSAALSSIYDIQAAGQFTDVGVGVAPLPGTDAPNGGVQVGGGALWLVGKGKSDVTKAASWDFAKWLNEPVQQALWSKLTGYIPIRKSAVTLPDVADLWKTKPTFRVAYDQLAASHAGGGPSIGPYKEFRSAIRDGLEAMVLKNMSVDDALALMEKEANAALTSYNERVAP
ncbi:MAG: ABC-type sugar transport system, periplasmic component [Acidimicrobiales bacterium]|nr:ABC-type sugar transport system, periplasmic component [Acidimicrobiales bacterium]